MRSRGRPPESDPMKRHIMNYKKLTEMVSKDEAQEKGNLTEAELELNKLLETGIYLNSAIARAYDLVVQSYKRLLLINARYTELSDESIEEAGKIVKINYTPKDKDNKPPGIPSEEEDEEDEEELTSEEMPILEDEEE